ncbi:sigma-70 family RNA polymerase sigma factor [Sutcliffiella horikoshii]|uniref:Sigma-70 family RNA polymerase sigma factor n=1 Tax=Sutcliffiella horikoshii TaxID=79883 RepID=A0A5D4T3W4_9BACI|nr:sigma-70 family RNA polymerase sigma factor [Sutcliffiella horikoshii]TYS70397.1 sigma-70 family RNA polymerase sigma factor [Sutcliffiella horikoshii]
MTNANKKLVGQNALSQEECLQDHYRLLLRYCLFLTKNEWDGCDLAQETMAKTIKHYAHGSVISQSLLKKIAYNKWIDVVRSRQKEIVQDVLNEEVHHHDLEKALIITDTLLTHTTPKQAVIFFLTEAFNYQSAEIADMLGTTEGAVKAALHRSRKRLNKKEAPNIELMDSFWSEEEKQLLPPLFLESLQEEDPGVLIDALPTIFQLNVTTYALPTHTPNNAFKCAA